MKNYSQTNEQETVLKYFESRGILQGKLLEIGAFDGEQFSNVRGLMVKHNGWKGVFVEPSSYCFSKLTDLYKMEPRRAELLNIAVVPEAELDDTPLLKFYDSPMSAVSSSVEGHPLRWYNEVNADGDQVNPRLVYVAKIGMKEILEKFGPFDMINIDVEGYSAKLALQDWFNPNDYGCKLICIEQDGMWSQLQQKFLLQGYSQILLNAENLIMARM
jgi:FkbM family methyltransferase